MKLNELLSQSRILKKENGDKKSPNKIIIAIIVIAILLLLISSFVKSGDDEPKDKGSANINIEDYILSQEKRLETVLKKINGAGNVSVFISIDGGGEKILAKNEKSKSSEDGEKASNDIGIGTKSTRNETELESQVVLSGKSSVNEPYVIEEKVPEIVGILVVADGASDESVRLEIFNSVKALYGIAPHRINVTY